MTVNIANFFGLRSLFDFCIGRFAFSIVALCTYSCAAPVESGGTAQAFIVATSRTSAAGFMALNGALSGSLISGDGFDRSIGEFAPALATQRTGVWSREIVAGSTAQTVVHPRSFACQTGHVAGVGAGLCRSHRGRQGCGVCWFSEAQIALSASSNIRVVVALGASCASVRASDIIARTALRMTGH